MKKHLLYFLSTVLGFCAVAQSPVIYVKTDGTGNGTSWSNACNIEYVIGVDAQLSVSAGTEIWVQQGTYYPAAMLTVPDSVKLYGGFVGTENDLSQRDVAANPTIIDAQKKFGSVIDLEPFSTLDGFTIQNGFANDNPNKNGGGVWAKINTVISNCVIINNFAYSNGGGIYAVGDAEIIQTTVKDNTAGRHGQDIHGCCVVAENSHTSPFICEHPSTTSDVRFKNSTFDFEALTVAAIGTDLSYQWYSNTANKNVGGTAVGSNTSSFIPSTVAVGTLYYYCVVSNDYGKDTSRVSGLYRVIEPFEVLNLDYIAAAKEVIMPPGVYMIECWGAQGADGTVTRGGYGGYVKGLIELKTARSLFVYVGGKQSSFNSNKTAPSGYLWGGGASDVRLVGGAWSDVTSLRSRIAVAGGGGAGSHSDNAGVVRVDVNNNLTAGGGLVGLDTRRPNDNDGGTQTTAGRTVTSSSWGRGYAGGFGYGGYSEWVNTGNGGSGYYGGGGATPTSSGNDGVGAGGSSFISGHSGCNAVDKNGVHQGTPNHYSGLIFTETVITAGNASMPNPHGSGTLTGNPGHGFVRITRKK